jgi:hypothetical protein
MGLQRVAVMAQSLEIRRVIVFLIPVDVVYTELNRVLRDKPAPFAQLAFVKHPRALSGFLAGFKGVLATPIRGAIRLHVSTRAEGYLQTAKGTVSHHGLWVNVSYSVAHVYRVAKKPPVAKGL